MSLRNNVDSKLVIAKYADEIVHISQYQESVHKGKLFCPFCKPPIRVTAVTGEFFRAWPNEGRHNCKKTNVEYFDTEWEGKQYVEFIGNKDKGVHLIIDINALVEKTYVQTNVNTIKSMKPQDSKHSYPKYAVEKKVFRRIVRTVVQMKSIISKNSLGDLNGITYSFKTGPNETLQFKDILFRSCELHTAPNNQMRFCIFIIDSIEKVNDCIHIKSTTIRGKQVIGVIPYPYDVKNFPLKNNQCVIAFGKICFNKDDSLITYLNIPNDFMIQELDESTTKCFFTPEELSPPTNSEGNIVSSKVAGSRVKNVSVEIINPRYSISKPAPNIVISEPVSFEDSSSDLTLKSNNNTRLSFGDGIRRLFKKYLGK
jgi:hypothetical protein